MHSDCIYVQDCGFVMKHRDKTKCLFMKVEEYIIYLYYNVCSMVYV